MKSPDRGRPGSITDGLTGVAATSRRNAWAVGSSGNGTAARNLALSCG